MKDTSTKSISKGIIGAVLAVIVFVVVWLLLSALYGVAGMVRDEGELWNIIMKDALAPGFAAYLAFETINRVLRSVHWRIAFALFVAAIALLAVMNLAFISEFYLSQGRESDWHITLIATLLSAISAIIGAFVSCHGPVMRNVGATKSETRGKTAKKNGEWGLVFYYTFATWAPIAVLIHVPNEWWGLIVKFIAVLWLLGIAQNYLRNPALISLIGSAGAGFILNGVWFAALNFWPPYWARAGLIFLILTTLWTCNAIIRKMMSNPTSELEQIYRDGGPDLRSWRNKNSQSMDGIGEEEDELTKEFHRRMDRED